MSICKAIGCGRKVRNEHGFCFQHFDLGPWNPVDTIPTDKEVTVKTVKGLICRAVVRNKGARWIRRPDKYGPRRVYCYRTDGRTCGDVVAVGWSRIDEAIANAEKGT